MVFIGIRAQMAGSVCPDYDLIGSIKVRHARWGMCR